MKTAEDLKKELSPEAYNLWVKNIVSRGLNPLECKSNKLCNLISGFFHWHSTPEGNEYWYNIFKDLL